MNILYLSYTGLTEPLGVSQVLAYLKGLARDHRITLISFEKPAELANAALMAELHATCAAAGIRWVPLRYHYRPRLPATLWDLTVLFVTALREARALRPDIIHARAYIPTFIGALVGMLTRTPYIFDTRSFWPEEVIAAGRLKRGSVLHRLIAAAERACMREAAGIVFLTRAAADYVRREDPVLADADIVTIPTCADLARFTPAGPRAPDAPLRFGTVGTVASGWFLTPWLMAFFAAILRRVPAAELHIISRDDPSSILKASQDAGIPASKLSIYARRPADIPVALQQLDAFAMFFTPGLAKIASCPTRMAEALGCGVPVVTNEGVGDVGEIVRGYRVGVIAEAASAAAMDRAVDSLLPMLRAAGTARSCRDTAERLFSVQEGVAAYDALYQRVVARRSY